MIPMKPPSKKQKAVYPDETEGSKIAREMREEANKLTREQEEECFKRALAMIYGGSQAASVRH